MGIRLLAELPRTRSLPDVVWAQNPQSEGDLRVDRTEDPEGWAAWAGRNVPPVTQWADQPDPDPPSQAVTSSPQPSLVAEMDARGPLRSLQG